MLVFLLIFCLVIFLLWFGVRVEFGRVKPNPNDKYFAVPFIKRNVDYTIGVMALPLAVGIVLIYSSYGLIYSNFNIVGWVLVVVAALRAILPPRLVGPRWYKKQLKRAKRFT